jgi:hypothetical protein
MAHSADAGRELDRRPNMMPCSLAKAITEPVKVMAPMTMPAESSPISTALSVPRLLVDEGADGDQHRGHTDEAVQCRHQLRHGRHLDAQRETMPITAPR